MILCPEGVEWEFAVDAIDQSFDFAENTRKRGFLPGGFLVLLALLAGF